RIRDAPRSQKQQFGGPPQSHSWAASVSLTVGRSFVAVRHPDNAFAGFALFAGFDRGEPRRFAISACGGADIFPRLGRSQCGAFAATGALNDLTTAGAAFAEGHLIGT